MQPRLGSPEDRKRSLIVGGLVLLPLVLFALFAWRPATLIGIDGTALNSSVSGLEGNCAEMTDDLWRCRSTAQLSSGAEIYTVRTGRFGCWDAWNGERSAEAREPMRSGCIDLFDHL